MLRNKEVKFLFAGMLLITLLGAAWAYAYAPAAGYIVLGVGAALFACVFLSNRRRYKELARLGAYLKRVNAGDYSLALADMQEGELSILQSEIYKVTVALQEKNQRLEGEKNRMAQALSDISHQLKTPITSLSIMADLLAGDLEGLRREQFNAQMRTQLARLAWLTEALLKLSRLDAHAVHFLPKRIPLAKLLEEGASPLRILMDIKGQQLLVSAQGEIVADPAWTAEAVTNVLKNCAEHTPQGGNIRVMAEENALFSEIRIADGGKGIPKGDLPYIFRRFYRGENAAPGSVGIGIAMARAITEEQGGTLGAKNAAGGAEFIFRFPKK